MKYELHWFYKYVLEIITQRSSSSSLQISFVVAVITNSSVKCRASTTRATQKELNFRGAWLIISALQLCDT